MVRPSSPTEYSVSNLVDLPEWQLLVAYVRRLERACLEDLVRLSTDPEAANVVRGRIEILRAVQKWPVMLSQISSQMRDGEGEGEETWPLK